MSEPVLRLGESRSHPHATGTLWGILKHWLFGDPAPVKPAVLPRPPKSVLASRTLAKLSGDESMPARRKKKESVI
jgi:hypothetical protein